MRFWDSSAIHPLLAAVVVAAEGDPASLEVVTLDDQLIEAAEREGFTVLGRQTPTS